MADERARLDLDRVDRDATWLGGRPSLPGQGGTGLVDILAGPDINVQGGGATRTVSRSGETLLLFDSGGAALREYAGTSAGLDAASAAATAGDVITIPTIIIGDDHILTADVHYKGISRYATVLTGMITGGAGTTLECLTVERTANDANILRGIVGPATGTMKIRDCDVTTTQSGAGNSYAVCSEAGGDVEVWLCAIDGQSVGGIGYGGNRAGAGNLYIYGGRCVGSSYPCSE